MEQHSSKQSPEFYLKESQNIVDQIFNDFYNTPNYKQFPGQGDRPWSWIDGLGFDTIIDYLDIVKNELAPGAINEIADKYCQNLLKPYKNCQFWYVFLWGGLSSARAATRKDIFPDHGETFFKLALNFWAAIHGPGWELGSSPENAKPSKNDFVLPFNDLFGWDKDDANLVNLGAGNAVKYGDTYAAGDIHFSQEGFSPMYPNAIWNSVISAELHTMIGPIAKWAGTWNCAEGIQNTMINAGYALLSLRLYKCFQDKQFEDILKESRLDKNSVLTALSNQISWWDSWLTIPESGDTTDTFLNPLVEDYSIGAGPVLIRERTPRLLNSWDRSYFSNLAWSGDQGLLGTFLLELEEASSMAGIPSSSIKFSLYKDILSGVEKTMYGEVLNGTFLRPWVKTSLEKEPDFRNRIFPVFNPNDRYSFREVDNVPYRLGGAVFYRFLLQAYKANEPTCDAFKSKIFEEVNKVLEPGFPDEYRGILNESYTRMKGSTFNNYPYYEFIPMINRLSLMVMAYHFAKEEG